MATPGNGGCGRAPISGRPLFLLPLQPVNRVVLRRVPLRVASAGWVGGAAYKEARDGISSGNKQYPDAPAAAARQEVSWHDHNKQARSSSSSSSNGGFSSVPRSQAPAVSGCCGSLPLAGRVETPESPRSVISSFSLSTDMESGTLTGSPGSSRTSTPTLVRSRPKLPVGLIANGVQGKPPSGHHGLDIKHITKDLFSTDFVRKYSRKRRSHKPGDASPRGGDTTPDSRVSMSPEPDSATGSGGNMGVWTLPRFRIKLDKHRTPSQESTDTPDAGGDGVRSRKSSGEKSRDNIPVEHKVKGDATPTGTCSVPGSPAPTPAFTKTAAATEAKSEGSRNTNNTRLPGDDNNSVMCVSSPASFVSAQTENSPVDKVAPEDNSSNSKAASSKQSSASQLNTPAKYTYDNDGFQRSRSCPRSIISCSVNTGEDGSVTPEGTQPSPLSPPTIKLTLDEDDDAGTPQDINDYSELANQQLQGNTQLCTNTSPYQTQNYYSYFVPVRQSDGEDSPVNSSQKLKFVTNYDKDSDDASLLVTEDSDSGSPRGPMMRYLRDASSLDTEDEGVDINEPLDQQPRKSDISLGHRPRLTIPVLIPGLKTPIEDKEGESEDSPRRLQRLGGEGGHTGNRFLTHPPVREKSLTRETGARDSNGFGSLREDPDKDAHFHSRELSFQTSVASLDSHISPSEPGDTQTYQDVVRDVTSENIDKLERKNSKTLKQKSKSDPSAEKQKQESVDLPTVLAAAQTQSTPMLSDEQKDRVSQMPEFSQTDRGKKFSKSDNLLSASDRDLMPNRVEQLRGVEIKMLTSDESSEENLTAPKQHRRPSKKRRQGIGAATELRARDKSEKIINKTSSGSEESIKSGKTPSKVILLNKPMRKKDLSSSVPSSPALIHQTSPNSTLERNIDLRDQSTLLVPGGKKNALIRSHSSASVQLHKADVFRSGTQTLPSGARPKELQGQVRKSRGTSFLENLATVGKPSVGSVPELTGHARHRTWASYHPPLEPISQSSLSLFDGPDKGKVRIHRRIAHIY